MKIFKIFFLTNLMIIFSVTCFAENSNLPRVAVFPFNDQSPKKIVLEGDMNSIIDEIVIYEINSTGKFQAFTRTEIKSLTDSISFDNSSGLVDPTTAAQFGKMIGVEYLVLGTVNGFKSNKSGNYTAYLSVRMIKVETAEIFYSGRGEGKSKENMLEALRKATEDALNGKRGMLTMMRGRK